MCTIAVTGGRDFGDKQFVIDTLIFCQQYYNIHRILVGDCKTGVDKYVRDWCVENGMDFQEFEAKWHRYGLAAGPTRNAEMLSKRPDYLLAFPGNKGTNDCVKQAKKKWIPVIDHRYRH